MLLVRRNPTMKKIKTSYQEHYMPGESSREALVQALKDAVDAGTYQVDNGRLADSLLGHLLQELWEEMRFKQR